MTPFQAAAGYAFANADPLKAWDYFKLPSLRIETLLEAHRKNTVALTNASQAALEGFTTVVQRQGSLLETMVDEYRKVASDVLATASFEEKVRKQSGAARNIYDSTVARSSELYDIATKANVAAVDILTARITESFEELRALFVAPTAPAVPVNVERTPLIAAPAAKVEALAGHKDVDAPVGLSTPAEPTTSPSAEPPPVVQQSAAKVDDLSDDEDADTAVKPKEPTKAGPRTPRTAASNIKASRRPTSR